MPFREPNFVSKLPEDQRRQLDHYVTTEVKEALNKYRREALIGFLVLLFGVLAAITITLKQGDDSRSAIVKSGNLLAVDGCNRDFVSREEIRSVLTASQGFQARAFKNGTITQEQYDSALAFYEERLKALPLPDCRVAQHTLTSDPKARIKVPDPRYPGDAQQQQTEKDRAERRAEQKAEEPKQP